MTVDIHGEEYIDFDPVLTSCYVRCLKHRTWDCLVAECQQAADRIADEYHRRINAETRRLHQGQAR